MASVYLAGPIAGLSYGAATDWRRVAEKALTFDDYFIETLSPMRAKEYLKDTKILNSYEQAGYVLSTNKGITTRDRFDVMRCDVVLCNLFGATEVSKGTMIELGWADAFRKPVVLVMEEGGVHDHAMVRDIAGFVVSTLEEGIEVVKAILCPSGACRDYDD